MPISRRNLMVAAATLPIDRLYAVSGTNGEGPASASAGNHAAARFCAIEFERNAFDVLADIHQNQQYLNVSRDDGRMLRIFTELANTKKAMRLGASTGYSGIWIALALRRTSGRLTTFEIDRARAATAAANFKRAGVDGLIDIVVGDAHKEVGKVSGPIDFVFSDADKEGYLTYFRVSGAEAAQRSACSFPTTWRYPSLIPAYIRAITTDPDYETVFFNMHRTGVAVSHKRG